MKKWFENAKISKKLSTGFLIISLLAIVIGIIAVISTILMLNSQQKTYNECTLGIKYASGAETSFQELRATVKDLYIYYDTDKDVRSDAVSAQMETLQTNIDSYGETISSDLDQTNYDSLNSAYNTFKQDINNILDAAKSGTDYSDMLVLLELARADNTAASDAFEAIVNYNDTLASDTLSADKTKSIVVIIIMILVILSSFIVSKFISKVISETINNPMEKFAMFGKLLAVGDIEVDQILEEKDKLLKYRKDEVGTLAAAFNEIISGTIILSNQTAAIAAGDLTTEVTVRSEKDVLGKALHKLVSDFNTATSSIISSADQVSAGSAQVSSGAQSLAQGSTEQASSIEELSASITEVSQRINDNAENAEKAKELSERSETIMQSSVANMDLAREAMNEISSTSKDISKVIKAIDDIAFQTNILALNAAVEAARAGAAGKGFAVVADEVRNLSQKSAEAAKNTTALIESSILAVEKGTLLVNKTSETFSEVATKSTEIVNLVDEIAVQAQGQATAVAQISIGIDQVSSVVQMNSATSEEAAAASEELSSQASILKEAVKTFKVKSF